MSEFNWDDVAVGIAKDFAVEDIDFRVSGKQGPDGLTPVVAYVNRAALIRRLNEVAGPANWNYRYEVIALGEVADRDGSNPHPAIQIVKGFLTIGGVTKEDVGDAADKEPTKSAVTDAFKRACFLWGLGVELAEMSGLRARSSTYGAVDKDEVIRLRKQLQTGVAEVPSLPPTPSQPTPRPNQASGYRNQGNYVAAADSEPSADEQYEALGSAATATLIMPRGYFACPVCGKPIQKRLSSTKKNADGSAKEYYVEVDNSFHERH